MRHLTLCYRKLIDAGTTRPWDKLVLDASYQELRLQAQNFDPARRYRTFGELLHQVPAAARLHGLVGGAVVSYLRQLGGLVPEVLDNLGRRFLRFEQFQFEVVNSDLLAPGQHQVAINFFSEPLRWLDTVGPYLVVEPHHPGPGGAALHTFQLQPFLAIHSLTAIPADEDTR